MTKIEKLIEPGEGIVYRARFGALRTFWELLAVAVGLFIGVLTGPGIVLVIIVLVVGIYSGRRHQEVVVTNQRLIYLRGWGKPRIDEINLRQVESIRNSGQRITVTGSGGTKLMLPHFLADEADLGRAIRNSQRPSGADNENQTSTSQTNSTLSQPTANTRDLGKRPFWQHPVFITVAVLAFLPVMGSLLPKSDNTGNEQSGPDLASDQKEMPAAPENNAEKQADVNLAYPRTIEFEHTPAFDNVLSVVEAKPLGYSNRSLIVRMKNEVEEPTLTSIATHLQNDEPQYERTFIEYYLPDMTEGSGAWATTNFTPDLKVQILGLKRSQVSALVTKSSASSVVGRWRDDRPYVRAVMTIQKQDGRFVLVRKFADGGFMSQRLTERNSGSGRRFDVHADDAPSEHLIIKKNGSLEVWDSEGLIFTARSVE
ncbi:MAG: hypothetical protein GC184_10620 [Rhizobiales bacterium]|nr:hypothetical protein [Hyphomicrobiales bacterium]